MAETKSLLFFCNLGISFTEMQTGCLGTAGGQRPSRALLLHPRIHGAFTLAGADLPSRTSD
jgi:hypothetical protein